MIQINIEIKKCKRLKEFRDIIKSKCEDILFSIVQKIPENFIPHFLMAWLEHYINNRIRNLKQQNVKQAWRKLYLAKAVDEIRQQDIENL